MLTRLGTTQLGLLLYRHLVVHVRFHLYRPYDTIPDEPDEDVDLDDLALSCALLYLCFCVRADRECAIEGSRYSFADAPPRLSIPYRISPSHLHSSMALFTYRKAS